MRGLIIKDFLVTRQASKSYLLFLAMYAVLCIMDFFPIAVCIIVIQGIFMMLPLAAFTYDTQAGWDSYGVALPLSRRKTVLARYLFAFSITLLVTAFNLVLCVGLSIAGRGTLVELIASLSGSMASILILLSIQLPIYYKFGTERARVYYYIFFILLFVSFFLASKAGLHLEDLSEGTVLYGLLGLLLLPLPLIPVSYFISCRAMEKKEF